MKSLSLKKGWTLPAISLLVLVQSCDRNITPEPAPPEPPEKVAAPQITLSETSFIIYPSACQRPVEFSFSVVSEEDGVKVDVVPSGGLEADLTMDQDGKGGKVKVFAKDSMKGDDNSVTLKASNSGGETTAVAQFKEAFLTIDRDSFSAKAAGATLSVSCSSNLSVSASVKDGASWISLKRDGSGIYTVTISRNMATAPRSAEVVFSDSEGLLSRTLYVSQEAEKDYEALEHQALVAIWESCGGKDWKDLSSTLGDLSTSTKNWGTDAPVSSWYGVTLNGDGRVIYLHLTDVGMKGTLPEEIKDLTLLQELWISGNDLSGPLPEAMGSLQCLKDLEASDMQLSGELASSSLGSIAAHLKILSLSGNMFTGGFPEWVGDMPENANFWLQGNCLEGKVPEKVKLHPRWNAEVLDGSGRTVGQINMQQREGHVLE